MYDQVIGKCSICGSKVKVPSVLMSIIPPVPTCSRCGAVEDTDLPVVKMKQNTVKTITSASTNSFDIQYYNTTKNFKLDYPKCSCVNGCKSAECDKI